MNHIGLFEGIGGFSLAARWMGWETIAWCEWNEFCQKVLSYHFPKANKHGDIKQTDFTIYRGLIDILTGGFPCQPYSVAGKRLGKEDERHLWPEMLRAIREIQPRWIVGENVHGIVNWNGGLVFNEVQADLEAEGYEVQSFILPACAVNAPHRRDRVWFVAFKDTNTNGRGSVQWKEKPSKRKFRNTSSGDNEWVQTNNEQTTTNTTSIRPCRYDWKRSQRQQFRSGRPTCHIVNGNGWKRISADSNNERLQKRIQSGFGSIGSKRADSHKQPAGYIQSNWKEFPTVSPIRLRNDGVSSRLLKFVVNELSDEISNTSEENRIKDLREVWERVQQEEIWQQIRRLYSLESKEILFQTMQLYSGKRSEQGELSPFSQKLSKGVLRTLRKYGEFRRSPQGQKLQEQRKREFADSMSFLPHEVALAARRFEKEIEKFEQWHRKESIKAGGNAVVPQVVYQIFKAIEQYESLTN